ncbi:hypothetical protein [Endozoicomonas sp. ONNA2]|uniref:hypothetical protein n=1 Tax=Endozoicomonas sp. ONNA2 TaxID=2828741 RepID=UPI002148B609|nr:hypothetical protein [Endozoicomonas sp. ONNA2]
MNNFPLRTPEYDQHSVPEQLQLTHPQQQPPYVPIPYWQRWNITHTNHAVPLLHQPTNFPNQQEPTFTSYSTPPGYTRFNSPVLVVQPQMQYNLSPEPAYIPHTPYSAATSNPGVPCSETCEHETGYASSCPEGFSASFAQHDTEHSIHTLPASLHETIGGAETAATICNEVSHVTLPDSDHTSLQTATQIPQMPITNAYLPPLNPVNNVHMVRFYPLPVPFFHFSSPQNQIDWEPSPPPERSDQMYDGSFNAENTEEIAGFSSLSLCEKNETAANYSANQMKADHSNPEATTVYPPQGYVNQQPLNWMSFHSKEHAEVMKYLNHFRNKQISGEIFYVTPQKCNCLGSTHHGKLKIKLRIRLPEEFCVFSVEKIKSMKVDGKLTFNPYQIDEYIQNQSEGAFYDERLQGAKHAKYIPICLAANAFIDNNRRITAQSLRILSHIQSLFGQQVDADVVYFFENHKGGIARHFDEESGIYTRFVFKLTDQKFKLPIEEPFKRYPRLRAKILPLDDVTLKAYVYGLGDSTFMRDYSIRNIQLYSSEVSFFTNDD